MGCIKLLPIQVTGFLRAHFVANTCMITGRVWSTLVPYARSAGNLTMSKHQKWVVPSAGIDTGIVGDTKLRQLVIPIKWVVVVIATL